MRSDVRNNVLLLIISVVIGVICLEVGLRLFLNFRHRFFIVREINGEQYYTTNPNNWHTLQGQQFLKDKPGGTFRIFTFGGSTTEGSIHQGKVSFTKFLEWKLERLLPGVPVEVFNFGKAGETSTQVVEKVKVALDLEPDLFIIYSGNNEFINFDETSAAGAGWIDDIFSKSYIYERLIKRIMGSFVDSRPLYLTGVRSFEDKPICTSDEKKEVREKYRKNIESIVELAKNSNVNIILSTVVGNYKGWEPNRSVHGYNVSDDDLRRWRQHYYRGKLLLQTNKYRDSIEEFELARSIDSSFAEVNYQLARAYEKVGRYEDALREYINAANNDGNPKIASTFFNGVIKENCKKHQLACIDSISIFKKASEHSLIGYNIMIDAHHPSMYGEMLIADEIVKVMSERGIPVPADQWLFQNDKSYDWYVAKSALTDEDKVSFHQNRGLWFAKLSTLRYDPIDRIERAKYHFEKAYEINPDEFRTHIGFAIIRLLEHRPMEAKNDILDACGISPSGTVNVLNDLWISNLLSENNIHVRINCRIDNP